MIFEASIKTIVIDNKGNDKAITRRFLFENYETFGQVENKLYEEFSSEAGFEVCTIKISKLREIVNTRTVDDDKIFFATIVDKFYDAEKDETTETKYVVALYAKDISEAHQRIQCYMKQGLEDMELVGLRCTKIVDVIK